MTRLIAFLLLTAAILGGCKKNPPPPQAAPPQPTPEATPTPTPEPSPSPAAQIDKSASVIVLCYHRFEEKPRDGMALQPAEFERQMQTLKDEGFTVIPMQDFLAWRRGEKNIPSKSCVITIDDGYRSVYEVGWPILQKFGYPFTMFIYTDYVKGQPRAGGGSLSWEELAELRDAGVDIQSHTVTHSDLRSKRGKTEEQYQEFLNRELAGSRELLENKLGIAVNCLAYPYGNHNETVRKAAMAAGYEAAFSVYGQRIGFDSPPDQLGRYAVDSKDPKIFAAAMRMSGGGVSASYAGGGGEGGAMATAAATVPTEPASGATVRDPTPLIKADLSAWGNVDPASVEMRISGQGLVPATFDPATKTVSYRVTRKLRSSNVTVLLSASADRRKLQTQWSFKSMPENTAP